MVFTVPPTLTFRVRDGSAPSFSSSRPVDSAASDWSFAPVTAVSSASASPVCSGWAADSARAAPPNTTAGRKNTASVSTRPPRRVRQTGFCFLCKFRFSILHSVQLSPVFCLKNRLFVTVFCGTHPLLLTSKSRSLILRETNNTPKKEGNIIWPKPCLPPPATTSMT